jgi:polygalacturonase
LNATQSVEGGALPSESTPDTSAIQSALDACTAGQALRLVTSGSKNAFLTGPLTLPSGVKLWVDAGVTLYGTRDPKVYGSASALILAKGAGSGVVGDGVIDGQGGEPRVGATTSAWDVNGGGGQSPALIETLGATNFVLYRITLHNAPMFHVKLDAQGFIVWGITIETPSRSTNSAGTALTPSVAHNTDGVDPGESAQDGYIVCSHISDGDDHIAIKGSKGDKHLVIAHNRLHAGHGMSIGSEVNGGVSDVHVYDLAIDGTGTGLGGGSSNGIRIKSDPSRGGPVTNILYEDVCTRDVVNPILVTPHYSTATGSLIPSFQGIVIRDFHAVTGAGKVTPIVTLDGYDSAHTTGITLDNVVVDGVTPADVKAEYAQVTLGPGPVDFTPAGTGVNVTQVDAGGGGSPNSCSGKW